jgi:hypothetical protein
MSQESGFGLRLKAEQVTETVVSHYPGRVYELGAKQQIRFTHFDPHKNRKDGLVQGTTNEEVLQMLIHRTEVLDSEFPCEENKQAVLRMREALQYFKDRAAKVGTRVATSDVDRV